MGPRDSVRLDGTALTAAQVTALAKGTARAVVAPQARDRLLKARQVAEQVVALRPVYGHNTGVGANRTTVVPDDFAGRHGLRLLRSHSGGIGPRVPTEQVRAMLAVRLNQLLGAGTAISVGVVDRLEQALTSGHVPPVHTYGSVGTGDLSALAELGLALAGDLPWQEGTGPAPEPLQLTHWDALPLMSSGALTIGQVALAAQELRDLLDRVPMVAALSLAAVQGSAEPYAEDVHARRPHWGALRTAAQMRTLLGRPAWEPPLIQGPFGFRCLPQVHGAALDAMAALDRVLDVELNAACENPLLNLDAADYHHHGGFHQASLALALDQLRLALLGTAGLSTARLGVLAEPDFTGLPPFLAQDRDGSSGIMITEYAAQSALADLRGAAQPSMLGHAVLSRGVEEHASFASTAVRRLQEAIEAFRYVLACELLAAVRALRMRGLPPFGAPELTGLRRAAEAALAPSTADRKLTGDVHAAVALLGGEQWRIKRSAPPAHRPWPGDQRSWRPQPSPVPTD
ncbi:aromatic amino acid ammonia-lyase [Streptomyces sp. NPDC048483]|uniref:aromatic amino acid ammonia-lyase n=1 Tax=Streptomyces sp. NPDC048483 TaxID=3154927 RepID=UPI00341E0EEF